MVAAKLLNKHRKIFGFFAEKPRFCEKKFILTSPKQLGVLGCTSVEPITPGPSRRFSKILRPARFFKIRKREISDKFKNFLQFCLLSVEKPHQTTAEHMRQLTYQDPSFQWLKVLILGVEKLQLKVFLWVF